MDTDDIAAPPGKADPLAFLSTQDLDPMSVAELKARMASLAAEIARTRGKLERSVNHRASANAAFKRS